MAAESARTAAAAVAVAAVAGLATDATGAGCTFYLAHKRRACGFAIVDRAQLRCGHHATRSSSAHADADDDAEDPRASRLTCAYCSTLVHAQQMQRHVQRCPARQREQAIGEQPFFRADVNLSAPTSLAAASSSSSSLSDAEHDVAQRVLALLRRPELAHVWNVREDWKGLDDGEDDANNNDDDADDVNDDEDADDHGNHAAQQSDSPPPPTRTKANRSHKPRHRHQSRILVAHVFRRGLLDANTCAIELGAGKAVLSDALARISPQSSPPSSSPTPPIASSLLRAPIVVIDYGAFRRKADAHIQRETQHRIVRYRMNVKDVWIAQLPELRGRDAQQQQQQQVSTATTSSATSPWTFEPTLLGKHLCGGATDLAVHALLHAAHDGGGGSRPRSRVRGLAIATCCHHACTWSTYSNRAFLDAHGVDERMFVAMCRMSSWATIQNEQQRMFDPRGARQRPAQIVEAGETAHATTALSAAATSTSPAIAALTPDERIAIGRRIKAFLDYGRVLRLRDAYARSDDERAESPEQLAEQPSEQQQSRHDRRWTSELVQYARVSTTRENHLLCAWWRRRSMRSSSVHIET